MKIEVLGMGCPKCKMLYENVKAALDEIGLEAQVEKVENMDRIIELGIMTTPALAIDGNVVLAGKVLNKEEIKEIISK